MKQADALLDEKDAELARSRAAFLELVAHYTKRTQECDKYSAALEDIASGLSVLSPYDVANEALKN